MVAFDRPIGAPADTQELNYVCALHQTCDQHRSTASIDAVDIQCFLSSRYGVQVSTQTVTDTILQSLAWTHNAAEGMDEAEQMDQMEMVTILLIPYLCKAQRVAVGRELPKGVCEPAASVLSMVCQIIQDDVQFLQSSSGSMPDNNHPTKRQAPRLTAEWLQSVLRAYGEEDLAADAALIAAMVRHADGHQSFTAAAFGQALTADVMDTYDPADETRHSTGLQDAVHALTLRELFQSMDDTIPSTTTTTPTAQQQQVDARSPFFRVFTAPSIDLTAETYRSKSACAQTRLFCNAIRVLAYSLIF